MIHKITKRTDKRIKKHYVLKFYSDEWHLNEDIPIYFKIFADQDILKSKVFEFKNTEWYPHYLIFKKRNDVLTFVEWFNGFLIMNALKK